MFKRYKILALYPAEACRACDTSGRGVNSRPQIDQSELGIVTKKLCRHPKLQRPFRPIAASCPSSYQNFQSPGFQTFERVRCQHGGYVQCPRPAGRLPLRIVLSNQPPRSTSANTLPQLALATLGVTFGGSWLAMRGDGSEKSKTPPTNASSKDEEAFIQYGSHWSHTLIQPLTSRTENS